MKKKTHLLFASALVFVQVTAFAQDSTKQSAIKQLNKTSAASDAQYGKKIQQQTLFNNSIDQLNVLPAKKPKVRIKKSKL